MFPLLYIVLYSETAFLLLCVVLILQFASLADIFGLGASTQTLAACLQLCLISYCLVQITVEASKEWMFELAATCGSAMAVHVSGYFVSLDLLLYLGVFVSLFIAIRVLADMASRLKQIRPRKGAIRQTKFGDSLIDLTEITDRVWFTYPSPQVDVYLDQRKHGMYKVFRFPPEDFIVPLSRVIQIASETHEFLWGFPGRVVVIESEQGVTIPIMFACALLVRVGNCNSASAAISLFRRRRLLNDEDFVFPAPFRSQLQLLANPRSVAEQPWLLKRVEISRSSTYPVTMLKIVECSQGILVWEGHHDAGNFLIEDTFLTSEDYLVILANDNGFEWYSYFYPSRHLYRVTGLRSSFKYTDEVPELGGISFFCSDATEGIPLQPTRSRQPQLLRISVVDKNL